MEFLRPLWDHQLEGLKRAGVERDFAFFWEMGTGKTAEMINVLRLQYGRRKGILPTLILGPKIVLENWRREIGVHSKIPPERVVVLDHSSMDRRVRTFQEAKRRFQGEFLALTNYEILGRDNELKHLLLEWRPKILVLDESHRCKDHKAKQTKTCFMLADTAEHRYLLTGTPTPNGPLDWFAQFRILDLGETFGTRYFDFLNRYMYDKNAGMPRDRHFPDWQIRPGALDQINAIIKRKSMVVKKSECLSLPPFVRETRYVEMSPEQRRMYEEMKKDFITFITRPETYVSTETGELTARDKPHAIVAEMAMIKGLRLMQIASGHVKTEEGQLFSLVETPKMAALEELLRDLTPSHKVLVWAVFKENYAQIRAVCEKLELPYVEVHGEVVDKQAQIDRLNNDPSVRVLIGHPRSGGIGVNMTQASYSIFFSRSFRLEDDEQAEARNYRGGSEIHEKITRIDLVTRGTIEEKVVERLAQKKDISERMLADIVHEM